MPAHPDRCIGEGFAYTRWTMHADAGACALRILHRDDFVARVAGVFLSDLQGSSALQPLRARTAVHATKWQGPKAAPQKQEQGASP
jgi:hypothetical protein